MMRAFFMAISITLIILGAECLVLNKAVLAKEVESEKSTELNYWDDPLADPLALPESEKSVHKTITPPEWAPWTLVSAGVVMMLYSISMKREEGGE